METRKIRRLAPHIAERIAAGEMIERPSSVVKELVENSLDAGSTEIRIVLEDGGKSLIEITDNGSGMSPEDLEVCVERHATSKLSTLEDLENISTLGFRGEAIPSIAAVTDLSILTRTEESSSAYELRLGDLAFRQADQPKPERVTFGQFIDSTHGTRIRAMGLFSQVPARLKFLKSQSAEVTQVREWTERLALAYPHVGFQLISDDRTLLNLRPQPEEARVKSILSPDEDFPLLIASHEQDGFRDLGLQARIYWLQGTSSPNSKNLIQVVNRRAVKDRLLQQALLAPFRQALLPGQFPSVALFVQVNPAAIDVNVHPTKTEIRFLDNRKIFQTIENLVKNLIAKKGAPAIALPQFKAELRSTSNLPPPQFQQTPLWKATEPPREISSDPQSYSTPYRSPRYSIENVGPSFTQQLEEAQEAGIPVSVVPSSSPNPTQNPFHSARFIGSIFDTYIAYEQNSELILIDQHAAHERVRYEKLRKRVPGPSGTDSKIEIASQALLIPEVIKFPIEDREVLSLRLEWLSRLGFETELFGEDTLLFRAVPIEWGTRQLKVRLKNLIDRVLNAETPSDSVYFDEHLFESIASEACHSAVRARDRLEVEEMKELVHQLFQCAHPWNCPHGRPTVVKIPEGKLEEWFLRRV